MTMQAQLPAEAEILQHTHGEVFRRGESYLRTGAVLHAVRRGGALLADVQGSDALPYRVTVMVKPHGRPVVSCTCPYMDAGRLWCKHVVAALLFAAREPSRVEQQPTLAAVVAALNPEQLRDLVLRWAERDPDAYDLVRATAEGRAGAALSPEAARQAVRRRVRRVAGPLGFGEGGPAHAAAVARQVAEVVAEAQECLDRDDARGALPILEAVAEEFVPAWLQLYGSDARDASGSVFAMLGRAWPRAILTAGADVADRARLVKKLRGWNRQLATYGVDALEVALLAARVGWDALEPAGRRGADERGDEARGELVHARLDVLERAGSLEEARAMACAEGMHARCAALLLALGRAGEAAEHAREHVDSCMELLDVARLLWAAGHLEGALSVAEQGFALGEEGRALAALAAWLRDRAAGAGCHAQALRAAQVAFAAAPTLESWRALEHAAGDSWPALRRELLEPLCAAEHCPPGVVDVLVYEKRLAEALDAVGSSADIKLVGRVVEAAAETYPERVIPLCRGHAEALMDAGRAEGYEAAAAWLAPAKRAYIASRRKRDWDRYLNGLLAQHRQKYKLRPLLEALRAREPAAAAR
jgi:uncharacterized Zn finger protein